MSLFAPGLRLRVNCGFGVLIAIALGLTVFATWKLSAVRDSVERLSAENDYSTQVLEISNRLQIVRRAGLHYMVNADEDSIKEAAAAEADALDFLNKASATTGLAADRRSIYDRVKTDLGALRAKRIAMIGFINEMQAARAVGYRRG